MARVRLDLPETFPFDTEIRVRVTDVNYGAHVGNDTILAFCQEARAAFLGAFGYGELDVEGLGIIVADSAVIYRAEAFAGDRLLIGVAAGDHNRYGCDLFYRITRPTDDRLIAEAKTGIVFFDYGKRRIAHAPESFRRKVEADSPSAT